MHVHQWVEYNIIIITEAAYVSAPISEQDRSISVHLIVSVPRAVVVNDGQRTCILNGRRVVYTLEITSLLHSFTNSHTLLLSAKVIPQQQLIDV